MKLKYEVEMSEGEIKHVMGTIKSIFNSIVKASNCSPILQDIPGRFRNVSGDTIINDAIKINNAREVLLNKKMGTLREKMGTLRDVIPDDPELFTGNVDFKPLQTKEEYYEEIKRIEKSIKEKQQKEAEEKANKERLETENARTLHGRDIFYGLIEMWLKGFNMPGVEQPDRKTVLNRVMNSDGRAVTLYIKKMGGLNSAVRDCYAEMSGEQDTNNEIFKMISRRVAENIYQVASLDYKEEISDWLEFGKGYHDINSNIDVRFDGSANPHIYNVNKLDPFGVNVKPGDKDYVAPVPAASGNYESTFKDDSVIASGGMPGMQDPNYFIKNV